MLKKIFASIAGMAMMALIPTIASAATLNVGTTQPIIGGTVNLSGLCDTTAGSVQLSIVGSNGVTTQLGSANVSSNGTFNQNVTIPGSVVTGPATFTATCSNGTVVNSATVFAPLVVSNFGFFTPPTSGGTNTVSGICTQSGNNNGTVSFAVRSSGNVVTTVPASNAITSANGNFNATLFMPSSVAAGPYTFSVTCPNGSVFSNVILVDASGTITFPADEAPVTPTTTTEQPQVLADTEPFPVGGVNAGQPSAAGSLLSAIVLTVLGLGGVLLARKFRHQ